MGGLARLIVIALLLVPAGVVSAGSSNRADDPTSDGSDCASAESGSSSSTGAGTATGGQVGVSVDAGGYHVAIGVGPGSCQKAPEKTAEDVQDLADLVLWIAITTARANGVPV